MIAKQIYDRCVHILRDNLIEFEEDAIKEIIKNFFPDIRQIINVLQRLSLNGKIEVSLIKNLDISKNTDEMNELKYALIDKDWNKIRIWVHDNYNQELIYNNIYDNLIGMIDKSCVPDFVLLTGEYSYRADNTGYQEINLISYLTEVLGKVKFNV